MLDMRGLDLSGIAQLIVAVVAAATFVKTWLNGFKTDRVIAEQAKIKTDMRELAVNTNSIKDALVVAEKKASKLEGRAEQRAETEASSGTSLTEPR